MLSAVSRDRRQRWHYKLPKDWKEFGTPRVIVIDGQLRRAARHPNDGFLRIEQALPDRRSGFVVSAGDLPDRFNVKAAPCDLVFLHDWSSSRLPVASYDPKRRELRTVGPIGCAAAHYAIDHFEEHPRYWLEGHPDFADRPGEWFVDADRGEIVLIAAHADDEPPTVVLPRLTQLLVASGTAEKPLRNLVLRGIEFTATRFPMPPGGLAGAQATMHEPRDADGNRTSGGRRMLLAAVHLERAEQCSVIDCRFRDLGATALSLAGRTRWCLVRRCRIERVGGNGINLGEDHVRRVAGKVWYQGAPDQIPSHNRVEGSEISFCGEMLPGAVAIWAGLQQQLVVVGNFVHDTPYTGISLGWVWNASPTPAGNNAIRENRIEFVMQLLSDGGGIYTLGRQPGSVIEKNRISDVPANAGRAESNGMFLDQGTTGFVIRNNTIRRVDRSPLRFHRAGKNEVIGNRWELATPQTPAVRFNATAQENIAIGDNVVLSPQKQIYLIGNSLTWDTLPPRLDERVLWHVDCGKSLRFIFENPRSPCVPSSRIWPLALRTTQFDILCVQPHYGASLQEDVTTIRQWIEMQPKAEILIHTGWAPFAELAAERADEDPSGRPTHSDAYIDALIARLKEHYPNRTIRSTRAMNYLFRIADDIEAGRAPFRSLEELYRDVIHMKMSTGRYLMHNVMRKALGQPLRTEGFGEADPKVRAYLDGLLAE